MRWPIKHMVHVIPGIRFVRRVLIQPPPGWPNPARPMEVLQFLDGKKWPGTPRAAEEELTKRIQDASLALPWPEAILVGYDPQQYHSKVAEPLAWCVAATKTMGRILLLHRQPRLERLRDAGAMVLYFPERR